MLATTEQWKSQNETQPNRKFTQSKLSFSALKPKDNNIQLGVPPAIPVKRKATVLDGCLVNDRNSSIPHKTHSVTDENDVRTLCTKSKSKLSLSAAQRSQMQIATSKINSNDDREDEPPKKKKARLANPTLVKKETAINGGLSNNTSSSKIDKNTQSVKTAKDSNSNQSEELLKSSSKLKSARLIKQIMPPVFNAIDIHLTEDDLLQRIQLRELLFRFCSELNIEKYIVKLDNPQSSWVNDVSFIVVQSLLHIFSQKQPNETLVNRGAAEKLNNMMKESGKSKSLNNDAWTSLSDLLKSTGLDDVPEGTTTRFRSDSRNFSEDERIKLIGLLADCALHSYQFRESLTNKNNDNDKRIQLGSVIDKMQAHKRLSGARKAEEELGMFEAKLKKKTQVKAELMQDEEKLRIRTEPLGSDFRGNQYWKFSDLSQGAKRKLQADGWSQCIIVYGEGVTRENSEVLETSSSAKRWWAVRGHENVEQLRKWLKQEYLANFGQPRSNHISQSIDTVEANTSIENEDRIIQENLWRLIERLGDYVVWFKALEIH